MTHQNGDGLFAGADMTLVPLPVPPGGTGLSNVPRKNVTFDVMREDVARQEHAVAVDAVHPAGSTSPPCVHAARC